MLGRDLEKHKTNDARWICKCDCGTEKSVLGKYLRNGASMSCGCSLKRDYSGKRFGKLLVLETIYDLNGENRAVHKCKCDCGNIIYIKGTGIKTRKTCGCNYADNRKDLVGNKYGKLTVLEMLYKYKDDTTYCRCSCDCGNEVILRASGLKGGNSTSCGCIHSPNLVGKRFGNLTVIREVGRKNHQKLWECLCDCGCTTTLSSHTLRSGHTISCGCFRSENLSKFEVFIAKLLKDNGILFHREFTFDDCKGVGGKSLRFDFYLPDFNTMIEYDGMQHFKPIKYFGGEKSFNYLQSNDKIKNNYCKKHKINLIRIPYTSTEDDIRDIILGIIKNPVTITVA